MDDVIAVVTDLFFQSRISTSARHAGRTVRFVRSTAGVAGYAIALVDLDAGADVLNVIRELKASGRGPVIAFGPHVDTLGRKAARAAGADRVLAKSRFVSQLSAILQGPPKA